MCRVCAVVLPWAASVAVKSAVPVGLEQSQSEEPATSAMSVHGQSLFSKTLHPGGFPGREARFQAGLWVSTPQLVSERVRSEELQVWF